MWVNIFPEMVTAIQDYPRPFKFRSLKRFIGMVGFYARFIPAYGSVAATLHELRKNGELFCWRETHQAAFDSLKLALCEARFLQIPKYDKDFVLVTDASVVAVSTFLHQDVNGALGPIAYHRCVLTPAERKYSTYEKVCLALLIECETCRSCLQHKAFLLHCDNLALCWLLGKVKVVGRLGRWTWSLAQFKFMFQQFRRHYNVVVNALLELFDYVNNTQVSCGVLVHPLPVAYSSLAEHQTKDDFCADIQRVFQACSPSLNTFSYI